MSDQVKEILSSLTLEEKAAQVIVPILFTFATGEMSIEDNINKWKNFTEQHGLGGFFILKGQVDNVSDSIRKVQSVNPKIPSLIAADLESGAGRFDGCVGFPDLLALGATGDEELAYTTGKASAIEGRSFGVHWTYSPVLDIIVNPNNPITQNRSYGDDQDNIIKLAKAHLKGMQDHGLAACVKHFPGDGMDSHDQHICTSINSMPFDEWMESYGRIYKESFESDVWTVMTGHIALPSYCKDTTVYNIPTPATLSYVLTTELLRNELGFKGLIVSDAMGMGGVTGGMPRKERIETCINAGTDMLLFADIVDYEIVLKAAQEGRINIERLDDAVTNVLKLKKKLGLLDNYEPIGPKATDEQVAEFQKAATEIAQRSIVIVRNDKNAIPVKESKGKVLTVTIGHDHLELEHIDKELEKRGFEVDHLFNPEQSWFEGIADQYERIFVNFVYTAEWGISSSRSVGPQNRIFMSDFLHVCRHKTIFTSFASPYHLRDVPQLPNYINCHSLAPISQKEVVKVWFGELDVSKNKSPVKNLTRF